MELPPKHFLFTSESVSRGHPDKLCDFISDSILDAVLAQDPHGKVACESACKNSLIMVFGEIDTKAKVMFEQIVRDAVKEVGYDDIGKGLDYKNATVLISLDQQSPEIAQSVHLNKGDEDIGAGDQGLMIGYASDETEELMPLTHQLCNRIIKRLTECREKDILKWMRPDAKAQVTVEYRQENNGNITPVRIHTVLISQQHSLDVNNEQIAADLKKIVVFEVCPKELLDEKTIYHMNPSGMFNIGGPHGDAGLTGRKIIVDSYGGWGGHGGGAFSGKDPTKVDRAGAYAVRWVAKSLVASKFCRRCMVQVAYGIGIAKPISIYVNTYGTITEGMEDWQLSKIIERNFDLRPGMIMQALNLRRPIYKATAQCGHFGRSEPEFTWEVPKDLTHELPKKE